MVGAVKGHILHQVPNFIKIGQTVTEISRFLSFFKMAAAAILDFQKFEILTVDPLQEDNMRHRTKSYQNRSNGCRDIAI